MEGVSGSSGAEAGEEKLEAAGSKGRGAVEQSAWEGGAKRKRCEVLKDGGACLALALELSSSTVTASVRPPPRVLRAASSCSCCAMAWRADV